MQGLEIVPATRDHNEAIREIYNLEVRRSLFTLDLEQRTMMEQGQWLAEHQEHRWPAFVAMLNGSLAGYAALSQYQPSDGYRYTVEDTVYVHQAERGTGLGKLLLARLLEAARERSYHAVVARLVAGHESAIKLHTLFGFRQISLEKEIAFKFDRWLDVLTMQLLLPVNVTLPAPLEPEPVAAASSGNCHVPAEETPSVDTFHEPAEPAPSVAMGD
jgi:L-amino acid N-acyltransferase